jgi:hypothetical protein
MGFVMARFKHIGILLAVTLICVSARAERVICPTSLSWSFSGMHCAKPAGKQEAACPAPSALSKPSVLGPALCVSKGKCLGGGVPNSVGICTEPEEKLVKTYPYTKITHL